MSLVVERIVILPAITGIRDTTAVSIMSINTVTNAVSGVDLTATDPIVVDALAAYQLQASAQVAMLTEELATANATIATLQARITELEQAVIDLTPPPAPLSITRYQCDEWLTSANLLQPDQEVEDLIVAIVADPEDRRKALKRWKLGIAILRNDPMIETLGQLLGLNTEQLDAAFLVASQIQ